MSSLDGHCYRPSFLPFAWLLIRRLVELIINAVLAETQSQGRLRAWRRRNPTWGRLNTTSRRRVFDSHLREYRSVALDRCVLTC